MSSYPPSRFARLATAVRPHRRAASGVVALTLLGALIGALEPLLYKSIFDGLSRDSGAVRAVLPSVATLAVLALVRDVVLGAGNWLTWRTRLALQHRLLDATVSRLHRLPMEYHRGEGIGAVMTKLDRGIQGFVGAFGDLTAHVLPAIAYLLLSVVFMSRLSTELTLAMLVLVPLPAVIASLAAPTQVRREQRLLERWTRLYARFHEVLSGLITVRSFAMEDAERRRFLEGVEEANAEVARGVGFDTRIGALQSTVVTLARVITIAYGAYLVIEGTTTVGTVIAFTGYVGGLFGPVQSLAGLYGALRKAAVAVDTVFGILDARETIGDRPDAIDPGRLSGDLELRAVTFGYDSAKAPILRGVSFRARAGETVALVGPSGSGKTTITALIQRFYDPIEGEIRIDGRDVRELKQSAIRREIGVVLQDPVLFNDTVANNIAYGRPSASHAEIEAAARAAMAHDFIMALPSGYQTVVGERGGRLSVGEKQRIAIGRALLKDPPIIVLDEATSALDAETEAEVQAALDRLLRGRTAIVIAHRLATVVHADRIVVLRHGRIEDEGTHAELMVRRGYYAKLVEEQTRGLVAAPPTTLRPASLH